LPELAYTVADDGSVHFTATGHRYLVRRLRRGMPAVTLEHDGVIVAADRIDLHANKARRDFAAGLNGRADTVLGELVALTSILDGSDPEEDRGGRGPSQATALVTLALDAEVELFHDPNGEPFATFDVAGHRQTAPIRNSAFRGWLSKQYYDRHAAAPGSQAIQDALNVLAGKATYEGPACPVWVRLAQHAGRLYLDLGDDAWHAAEISPGSWRVIPSDEVPVKFRRPGGLMPLPEPDPSGSLHDLARFANLEDPNDLLLIEGWLVGTFCQEGGRPILELSGEQGSAKSTLARVLRRIVDPCTVPLRTAPRDERDLVIAATNGLVVAYDNLSDVKDWFSDALCRLSTGGGVGGRRLYTDAEEALLDAQRPSLVTGINSVATRSDLLDRTISVRLPPITEERRQTEKAFWAEFERLHPRLLGGLLNAVASALAHRDAVDLPRTPRLADFVAWTEAAAPALGWAPGEFLAAFEASRKDADAVAIEALPVGPAILTFMGGRDEWTGTPSALLHELSVLVDDETKRDRDWPKRANRLSNHLERIAPNLRQVGIWVGKGREGHAATRVVILTQNKEVWDRQQRRHRQQSGGGSRADQGFDPGHGSTGEQWPNQPPLWWAEDDADGADAADDGSGGNSDSESVDECCLCGAILPPAHKWVCAGCGGTEAP